MLAWYRRWLPFYNFLAWMLVYMALEAPPPRREAMTVTAYVAGFLVAGAFRHWANDHNSRLLRLVGRLVLTAVCIAMAVPLIGWAWSTGITAVAWIAGIVDATIRRPRPNRPPISTRDYIVLWVLISIAALGNLGMIVIDPHSRPPAWVGALFLANVLVLVVFLVRTKAPQAAPAAPPSHPPANQQ